MKPGATSWSAPPAEFNLSPNEVVIWRAALDCDPAVLAKLEATLSPDEGLRADRFHFSRDRRHFVAGRGILRTLLGRYLRRHPRALAFSYGPQGKPELAAGNRSADLQNHPVSFNLSHKDGLAVFVFACSRSLGVDLEAVAKDFPGEDIARRFFSPRELEELLALPEEARAEAFFLAWTRKEAYVKAGGQGLHIPLDSFDVSLSPGCPACFLRGVPPQWQIVTFECDRYHPCALVFDGPSPDALQFYSWQREFAE